MPLQRKFSTTIRFVSDIAGCGYKAQCSSGETSAYGMPGSRAMARTDPVVNSEKISRIREQNTSTCRPGTQCPGRRRLLSPGFPSRHLHLPFTLLANAIIRPSGDHLANLVCFFQTLSIAVHSCRPRRIPQISSRPGLPDSKVIRFPGLDLRTPEL